MKGLHHAALDIYHLILNLYMEETMDIKALEKTAAEVRVGIVKAIHNAGSGHPGFFIYF